MMISADNLISRRRLMQHGLFGAASLAFWPLRTVWAAPSNSAARAKSVIQIWMWGGPAHLDTFDPKPEAGNDFSGPLTNPIETNVSGIRISELLPELAQQADKYSLIRSMTHGINAHETASYLVQTGREPGRVVYPCAGAVISKMKGYDVGYDGVAPPYIVLTEPQGRFSEAGFLGQKYKPFATGGNPNQNRFEVEGIIARGISDKRQHERRELLSELDTFGHALPNNEHLAQHAQSEDAAYEMMFGELRNLFDLSKESDDLRERYGRNTFGQSCLVARRLVESGVPYVTINFKGWDTHKNHFQIMRQKLPELDKGLATLLQDLTDRGLLDSTIIWWGGEFGRTPRVQWEPPWNGGRGHFGACFSSLVAGGGFRGGQVLGASDSRGEEVRERPVSPQDLIGSIYTLMGIDPAGKLPNESGMDICVLDPPDSASRGDGLLKEIM